MKEVTRTTDDQVRPFVSKSFPELGFYWYTLNPNEMKEDPQFGTGDTIDDIVDIYKDLKSTPYQAQALLHESKASTAARYGAPVKLSHLIMLPLHKEIPELQC